MQRPLAQENSLSEQGRGCSSPRQSCPRSRCRNRTASGLARSGCSCSGTGRAHRCARHTPLWARPSRPRSRPLRHTSSAPGYSGLSPCSGTRPPRRSSGCSWRARHCRLHSHCPGRTPRPGDAALGDGTLELVGGTGHLGAVPLVLAISAVVLSVAAEDAGDTAVGVGALELTGQADVDVAVGLITVVLAVVVPVTDEGGVRADAR